MKRSRSGGTVHRDDCPRAKNAKHWDWADFCGSDLQFYVELASFPWLRLCQVCFDGDPVTLAFREAMP